MNEVILKWQNNCMLRSQLSVVGLICSGPHDSTRWENTLQYFSERGNTTSQRMIQKWKNTTKTASLWTLATHYISGYHLLGLTENVSSDQGKKY